MIKKPTLLTKVICCLLFIVCYFLLACDERDNGDPNGEKSTRYLEFSHNSGLYSQQFNLTITGPVGNTIYYSIDGSIPDSTKVGNGRVFKYTSPINVQNRNGQPNFLATPAARFYMRSDDPRGHMPQVFDPDANQVPKATVIRAIAVSANGNNKSAVVTRTYFIGNNLNSYGNVRIISLVTDPYNLVDEDYGIMVRGKSANLWDGTNLYNFRQRGEAWERVAFMELFEGNANSRTIPLSTNVGIRVRGGWSRGHGQKSLNIYFREEHGGINNFRRDREGFELIPGAVKSDGTPVDRTKSIMLRSGGNDHEDTKFYDVFIHDLLKDRSFTTQAAIPAILYLNGEYWGPYNFSERYSDNHTEYKYGVDRNLVISIDNGELDDGNPGEDQSYWSAIENFISSGNYTQFCNSIDIDNFVDYWAAQIYIYNEDWPHNNYVVWRTRTQVSGNPYGDTKWRYSLHDTEFSMGIYSGGSLTGQNGMNVFDRILNGDNKGHPHNRLFAALLENEEFSNKFVNTIMDLYNVNFHPDNFEPKLTYYASTYKPLMQDYRMRWGGWDSFDGRVENVRKYLTDIRPAMVNVFLPTYLGTEPPQMTVLFDFAEHLQTLTPQTITTGEDFYDLFDGTLISPAGGVNVQAIYSIVNFDGVNKFRVNERAEWGAGFDVNVEGNILLAGDVIEIKGTFISGDVNRMALLRNYNFVDHPQQWWNFWSQTYSNGQAISIILTLSASDVAAINENGGIRIRSDGIDPWGDRDDTKWPNGIATYDIEQIKVYRLD